MSTNALGVEEVIAVDPMGPMTETWHALDLEALGGRVVRPVAPAGVCIDPLAVGPMTGHAEDEEAIS